MLQEKVYELLPDLKKHNITATFAGLRPASDKNHYRVKINDEKNWITVGGIRSTGLTASLGLAKYVFELNNKKYETKKKKASPIKMQNISEFQQRDYQDSNYGKIVCHCECVTQREIENALKGEVPAGTIGGLKRRTRVTMGRCQGFNCQSAVSEICEKSQS